MSEELVLDDAGAPVIEQPIASFAERAYLEYAMSVVKSRALPALCDGQKPVQRRILFAMNEMRLSATSKHVKSARVVGDVIGKYHPHGDSSVYEAMVRIAQDFSMRYPIVEGQGNFGSRDGDGAAAMRYTECRLTPIAELLLSELDSGTVDFGPNYDGAFEEPLALPARLPMLLLNGASGIAVGMATEIPSHNLREVADAAARIVRQETFNLLEVIPGPDYPGGGQIISSTAEIAAVYESGRGSLRGRARWTFEDLARGQWRVIVHELPHGVGCAKVLEELEALTNPQVKAGKKALSQDQLLLKQTILSVLDTARDESSKDQAVRLVFEPKSSRVGREELMQVLLAHTSLEVSLPINLVMIGLDGAPRQKPLRQILEEWVAFRLSTVERRLRHRLDAVLRRLHVLEGRKIVYLNLDDVIHTIREADEPKTELMAKFGLSETQAEDILEIRLRQLARLEWLKIEQEIERLTEEKHSIESLLADETKLRGLVADEIEADTKRFGDDRRTLIEAAQSTTRSEVPTVVDEPMTLIVSKKGWVRARAGHHVDPQTLAFKDGDSLMVSKPCRTTDTVIFLSTAGRTFSLPCTALPNGRGDGAPLSSLLETAGAKIAAVFVGPTSKKVLLAASNGYGFLTTIGDMVSRQKSGKAFMTIADKETILHAVPAERDDYLLLVSAERFLAIRTNELRTSASGGKGLQLIALAGNDTLKALHLSSGGFEISLAGKRGKEAVKKLVEEDLEAALGRRGAKGRPHEGVKLVVAIEADPNAAAQSASVSEASSEADGEASVEEGGEPA